MTRFLQSEQFTRNPILIVLLNFILRKTKEGKMTLKNFRLRSRPLSRLKMKTLKRIKFRIAMKASKKKRFSLQCLINAQIRRNQLLNLHFQCNKKLVYKFCRINRSLIRHLASLKPFLEILLKLSSKLQEIIMLLSFISIAFRHC
jgi:hypothetical protein